MSTSDVQVVLCEQEAADIQRYIFRESPPRSPTPQDSEGDASGSTPSGADSSTEASESFGSTTSGLFGETLPGLHVPWEPVARPHVSDRWCADQPGSHGPCNPSFAKVIRGFEWLDNHFALPCFVIPPSFPSPCPVFIGLNSLGGSSKTKLRKFRSLWMVLLSPVGVGQVLLHLFVPSGFGTSLESFLQS